MLNIIPKDLKTNLKRNSKAEFMSGRGYLFFTVMSFKPLKSIHGRVPSFLPMKKNPAPRGDEEGWIIPAASELLMYSSIATRSGLEMLYRRLRGNVDPGNRSMAQSYGRCGGSESALCLQNTSEISWYSAGIDDRSGRSGSGFWWVTEEGRADRKQLARQVELQL